MIERKKSEKKKEEEKNEKGKIQGEKVRYRIEDQMAIPHKHKPKR